MTQRIAFPQRQGFAAPNYLQKAAGRLAPIPRRTRKGTLRWMPLMVIDGYIEHEARNCSMLLPHPLLRKILSTLPVAPCFFMDTRCMACFLE